MGDTEVVWVRFPAGEGFSAGPKQQCRLDSVNYAWHLGYEKCDPPTQEELSAAAALVAANNAPLINVAEEVEVEAEPVVRRKTRRKVSDGRLQQ